jgi:hypothetical protein
LAKIDLELPIEINTHVFVSCLHLAWTFDIHIFPFWQDLALSKPMLLDIVNTINVENGHEDELIVLQEGVPVVILLNLTKSQKFKHLVKVEIRRDKLSSMCSSSHEDRWLSISNLLADLKWLDIILLVLLSARVASIFKVIIL